jgi:hypothetical protein
MPSGAGRWGKANFAFTEFCEVQVLFVLWGTYLFVGQEYAAFVAWPAEAA